MMTKGVDWKKDVRLVLQNILQATPVRMVIGSSSLAPLIVYGSRVTVQSTPFCEIRLGDIVAYKTSDYLVCHQVVRRTDRYLRTRALSNPLLDPPVLQEDILGRVTSAELPDGTILDLNSKQFRLGSLILASYGLLVANIYKAFQRILPSRGQGAAILGSDRLIRWAIRVLHVMAKVLRVICQER